MAQFKQAQKLEIDTKKEPKNEIDLARGLSDLKVAHNPDFGYENMFSPVEKERPSPWKLIADAISDYPHFQLSSKLFDQVTRKENNTFKSELQKRINAKAYTKSGVLGYIQSKPVGPKEEDTQPDK